MLAFGLIGYPLEKSLSPNLHGAALHALGISGEYRLYPVAPLPAGEEALAGLVHRLRQGDLQGLNVTIPHKQTILSYLDELSPRAAAIGAVNTISCREGKVIGENTDAAGFLSDLERQMGRASQPRPEDAPLALVLGAGGAARAVVYALRHAGWAVIVAARRLAAAEDLVASLQTALARSDSSQEEPAALQARRLDRAGLDALQPELIVNASAAGMIPQIETDPYPNELPLPAGAFLYDLVYKPPETALLRRARASGLRAVNGLGMLVEQAALAFTIWTGREAPRPAMWQAVAANQPGAVIAGPGEELT